jgi:hypothetical protein
VNRKRVKLKKSHWTGGEKQHTVIYEEQTPQSGLNSRENASATHLKRKEQSLYLGRKLRKKGIGQRAIAEK